MYFVIPLIGSRGDIQPYIPLAVELKKLGHSVRIGTHLCMKELIQSYGIDFTAIGPDLDMGVESARLRRQSKGFVGGMIKVMQFALKVTEQCSSDVLNLISDADFVVIPHSFIGSAEAAMLRKRTVSVTLQPWIVPTGEKPRNPIDWITGRFIRSMMLNPYNKLRKKIGAPLVKEPHELLSTQLNLIPISPTVFPQHPGWQDYNRLVGYWLADAPENWTAPQTIVDFLSKHPNPVVFCLGAMSFGDESDRPTVELILEAIRTAGFPAIIQGWNQLLLSMDLPESVLVIGSMPHSWLFNRSGCIVHHGGFGTTGTALASGKPSVVIPHIIDQFLWAQKVESLGVGPKPIPRDKLTAENLAESIRIAMTDENIRKQAFSIGETICSESNTKQSAQIVELYLNSSENR